MASTFVNVKKIDSDIEFLVSGFIREMQVALPQNATFYIILKLINYECLRFYFLAERFMKCGSKLKIKKEGAMVYQQSDDYNPSKEKCNDK